MNTIELNRIRINTLALNRLGGGARAKQGPQFEEVSLSGMSYLFLENAAENGIISLTVDGKGRVEGTPLPTAPAILTNNLGEIVYGVTGNNLLEVADSNIVVGKYINNNGVVTESLPNCYFQRFVSVKASTAYTLSTDRSLNYVNFMEYDANGVFLRRTLYGSSSAPAGAKVTHYMSGPTAFVIIGSNVDSAAFPSISKEDVKSIKWMFNLGTSALPYEPYKVGYTYVNKYSEEDKISVNYDDDTEFSSAKTAPLLALGDAIDQQEIITGLITRRVGIKVFDGSEESWYLSMSGDVYRYRFRFADEDNIVYENGRGTDLLCTHFKVLASGSTANGCFLNGSSNAQYLFLIPPQTIVDLESFRQWLQMEYAKGTPVMVAYLLAEPVTETVDAQPLTNPLGDVNVTRYGLYSSQTNMTCVYRKAIIDIPKGFATLQDAEGYNLQGADGAIVLVKSEDSCLITFSVEGYGEMSCPDGMTWWEFINSEYNIHGFIDELGEYGPICTHVDEGFLTRWYYIYDNETQNVVRAQDVIKPITYIETI